MGEKRGLGGRRRIPLKLWRAALAVVRPVTLALLAQYRHGTVQ